MSVLPSPHALKRYRQHHPGATRGDMQLAVGTGIPVEPDTAHALCGRPAEQRLDTGSFVLAPDRRGLFVLVPFGPRGRLVITYLRFGPAQEDFAVRSWPARSEPTVAPIPSATAEGGALPPPCPALEAPAPRPPPSIATAAEPPAMEKTHARKGTLASVLGEVGLGSFACSEGMRMAFGSEGEIQKCLLDGFVSEETMRIFSGQALLLACGAEREHPSPRARVLTMLCTTPSQRPVWVQLKQHGEAFRVTECATPRNADDWDVEIR
jgi:hypothetical protein